MIKSIYLRASFILLVGEELQGLGNLSQNVSYSFPEIRWLLPLFMILKNKITTEFNIRASLKTPLPLLFWRRDKG